MLLDYITMEKEFNLIWVGDYDQENKEYNLLNPKGLMGMNLDKALGSLKWSKRIIPQCKCFIYDPNEMTIFNNDGSQNIDLINTLINTREVMSEQNGRINKN